MILIIGLIFVLPVFAHADTKVHRQCIRQIVMERKDALKDLKTKKSEIVRQIDMNINFTLRQEREFYESRLVEVRNKRQIEIQKAREIKDRKERRILLTKAQQEFKDSMISLNTQHYTDTQYANNEYKQALGVLIKEYKKQRQNVWNTFKEGRIRCSRN